jgi:type III pantothenate kinase
MMLLLDAGNSRLKWAVVDAGTAPVTGAVRPDEAGLAELAGVLAVYRAPERVAVVTVRGRDFLERLTDWCGRQGWPAPEAVRTAPASHGVRPAYGQLSSLGADRYAAMVAARRLFDGPLIVVDCGTAVTIDVLEADGTHLGGLIMPGLSLMRRALWAGTAAIPDAVGERIELLSDNTVDQVTGGTALGLVSAIDGLCRRIADRLGEEHARILTGGDAPVVSAHGALSYECCPWLVLQGVYFIMEGDSCEPWC